MIHLLRISVSTLLGLKRIYLPWLFGSIYVIDILLASSSFHLLSDQKCISYSATWVDTSLRYVASIFFFPSIIIIRSKKIYLGTRVDTCLRYMNAGHVFNIARPHQSLPENVANLVLQCHNNCKRGGFSAYSSFLSIGKMTQFSITLDGCTNYLINCIYILYCKLYS